MASDTAETAKSLLQVVLDSRLLRTFKRYGKARGGLLAGGIAYSALFSIVAALTIAWTIFMATLGKSADTRNQVIKAVNQALPGILQDSSGDGMIDPNSLILDSALNPASILATAVLVWTAISIMTNIRTSVQDMFGIVAPPMNILQQKLRDLFGFIGMAAGIVSSAVLGTVAGTLGQTVLGWLNVGGNPGAAYLVRAIGLVVASAVAMVTFAALFRITAAVRPPRRDLWLGSAIGGIVVQIILALGTGVVKSVSDNPLLAASASLATLLLFVNLLSRVLLLVAAFTANPPAPSTPDTPEEVHFNETPNFVTLSAPHTLKWEFQDVSGQIEPDPSLRPVTNDAHARARHTPQKRPDGKPLYSENLGFLARIRLKRKAHQHELRAVELRARLGQRPLIDAAEREYWADHARQAQRQDREEQDGEAAAVGSTSFEADPRDDETRSREHVVTRPDADAAREAAGSRS